MTVTALFPVSRVAILCFAAFVDVKNDGDDASRQMRIGMMM